MIDEGKYTKTYYKRNIISLTIRTNVLIIKSDNFGEDQLLMKGDETMGYILAEEKEMAEHLREILEMPPDEYKLFISMLKGSAKPKIQAFAAWLCEKRRD